MRTQNRPLLLRRAIGSVIQQTHKSWELVIVNDGGDPKCVAEALTCWPADSRIRVLNNSLPLGMEAASNRGIESGTGSFISVHDDDDSWSPKYLERTLQALRSERGGAWTGAACWVTRVEEQVVEGSVRRIAETPFNHWQRNISAFRMLASNTFPPICLLFRRECWAELDGFNERLEVLGDWDFHWRLLLMGDIGLVPESLARYHHRVQGESSRGAYGNTVVAGVDKHQDFATRYRNEWVREADRSGHLPVLALLAEQTNGLHERISQLEALLVATTNRNEQVGEGPSGEGSLAALEAAVRALQATVARSVEQLDSVLLDYNEYKSRLPWWLRRAARVNDAK